jgi:hypothetical protein
MTSEQLDIVSRDLCVRIMAGVWKFQSLSCECCSAVLVLYPGSALVAARLMSPTNVPSVKLDVGRRGEGMRMRRARTSKGARVKRSS